MNFFKNKYSNIIWFSFIFMFVEFILRTVLLCVSFSEINKSLIDILKIYFIGSLYDSLVLFCIIIIPILYVFFIPGKIYNNKIHKITMSILYFLSIFFLVFISFAEYFFWDEFGVRFNFIAVDYLIYTQEVVGNIVESYPMPLIFGAITFITALIFIFARKRKIKFAYFAFIPVFLVCSIDINFFGFTVWQVTHSRVACFFLKSTSSQGSPDGLRSAGCFSAFL